MRISRSLGRPLVFLALLTVGAQATMVTRASAANGSVAYAYDALGRVVTVSYDTGVCIIYAYDAVGNRLSETIRVSATGSPGVWGCFNWNQGNWGP